MAHARKTNTSSYTARPGSRLGRGVAVRPDQDIIDRVIAARARDTTIDVTDISDEHLLADLERRTVVA